jgi:hypothetical protein
MVLNRAFEYRGKYEEMLAGIGREAVVEKSHITDDQYHDARVAASNVGGLSSAPNRQS